MATSGTPPAPEPEEQAPSRRADRPERVFLNSVLVPIDFSDSSEKAIQYAVTLAGYFGATVTLAHVLIPVAVPDLVYGPLVWDEDQAVQNAKKQLQAKAASIRKSGGIQCDIVARCGHPYHEIDRIAKEIKADLIVIATHGHSGFKHLLLGSVAEKVIRHAPCPVLVVREKEHEFIRP